MPVHPQAQAVLDAFASMGMPPFETLSLEESRQVIESVRSFMVPVEEVVSVEDLPFPGPEGEIGMRIYRPEGEGPLPAVFYFHGGGFSSGSLDLVDPICRLLANRSGCVVISVDYRLAPEHPYPAAAMDAYVAISWIGAYGEDLLGLDTSRLAVVGESAGATLATAACMLIRDKNLCDPEITLQILLCPVTDLVKFETPSYQEFGEGHLLTTGMMRTWKGYYLTGCEDRVAETYCSPVREQNLNNLPPAIIITAEYDPLRDEGEAYGQLLLMNEVMAEVRREEGMIHNFFWFGGVIDRGREILEEVGSDLRKTLFIG